MTEDSLCPCGSNRPFNDCCAPLIRTERRAVTAEQLMRSRYCAFATGATDYLVNTLAPERRSANERRMLKRELRQTHWVKLEILDIHAGGASDTQGIVEFNAYYISPTGSGCLHERSNFRKEGEQWFYVDGEVEVKT